LLSLDGGYAFSVGEAFFLALDWDGRRVALPVPYTEDGIGTIATQKATLLDHDDEQAGYGTPTTVRVVTALDKTGADSYQYKYRDIVFGADCIGAESSWTAIT